MQNSPIPVCLSVHQNLPTMAPTVSSLGATALSGHIVKSRGQVAPVLPPTPMFPPTQATASTAPSYDANADLMAAIAKLGLAPESCGDLYKALYNEQAANALHEPIMVRLHFHTRIPLLMPIY